MNAFPSSFTESPWGKNHWSGAAGFHPMFINAINVASTGPFVAWMPLFVMALLNVLFHACRVSCLSISPMADQVCTHRSNCSVGFFISGSAVGPSNHARVDVTHEFVPAYLGAPFQVAPPALCLGGTCA